MTRVKKTNRVQPKRSSHSNHDQFKRCGYCNKLDAYEPQKVSYGVEVTSKKDVGPTFFCSTFCCQVYKRDILGDLSAISDLEFNKRVYLCSVH